MKTVFLLGGSGGIGRAVARRFQKAGWRVIAPTRRELDLEDRASIAQFFRKSAPRADALIHCAGWNRPGPAEAVTVEDLEKAMAVNVFGFFWVLRHLLPGMKRNKGGSVVAVSSLYGLFSRKNRLPYAASKHALNGLMRTLALELGRHGIRVNLLSPGFVDTAMTRRNNDPAMIRKLCERVPLGRLARPSDIAQAVYFLCSPEGGYIHGANLVVDGGYSIGGFQPE